MTPREAEQQYQEWLRVFIWQTNCETTPKTGHFPRRPRR